MNTPLHLSESNRSSSLPHADDVLQSETLSRADGLHSRRGVMRRSPYGVTSTSNSTNQDYAQRSSSVNNRAVLGASIIANAANSSIQPGAYNSYRYGTKSIARSRLAGTAPSAPHSQYQNQFYAASSQIDSAPDAALTQSMVSDPFRRGQKIVDDLNGTSNSNLHRQRMLLLLPVVVILCLSLPSMLEPLSKGPEWNWSPDRRLDGRQCVMNLFIERQAPDEFNPDYVTPPKDKSGKSSKKKKKFKQPAPKIEEGSYRTQGQVKMISRLIQSVADSFRSNTTVHQHLIFTGTRDGGHLAEMALKNWPPRGSHKTQLHVVASDHRQDSEFGMKPNPVDGLIPNEDPLEYAFLEAIETRFQSSDQVHIYDRSGKAGFIGGDDDDGAEGSLDMWGDLRRRRKLQAVEESLDALEANVTISVETDDGSYEDDGSSIYADGDLVPYPELDSFLPSDGENHIVPYMHVDGERMSDQMEILEAARPLLEDHAVVVLAMEHSPDMDIYKLLEFFDSVQYKTFFLGLRQVSRIDHLCKEILDDVIGHPWITPEKPTKIGRWLKRLGVVDHGIEEIEKSRKFPPFFVAMPRGRHSREEMTIQHMYDLFGGFGGGGGQVKTANDRKAPGKK